jgi:hypothetical protein
MPDLTSVLERSGLVLVETDPNQRPQSPAEMQQGEPPAPRRRRPAPPPAADEPLIQVETGK